MPKKYKKPCLLVIDGSYISYRAFYAAKNFVEKRVAKKKRKLTPQQLELEVIEETCRTMLNMVKRVIRFNGPTHVVAVFDDNRSNTVFRKQLYPKYKEGRRKTAITKDAFKLFKRMLKAYGIHSWDVPDGYEADDVIGSIVTQTQKRFYWIRIYSGDRDFAQLVNDKTTLLYPENGRKSGRELRMTPKVVEEVMGVKPHLVVPLKALVGDSSDGYNGVPRVGEKSAMQLLDKYSSIEEIYAHLDEIQPKNLRTRLIAGKEQAFLCETLAQIVLDIPLDIHTKQLKLRKHIREQKLFFEAEMGRLPAITRQMIVFQ